MTRRASTNTPGRRSSYVAIATVIHCLLGTGAQACDAAPPPPHDQVAHLSGCVAKLEADLAQLTRQVAALQSQLSQAQAAQRILTVRRVMLEDATTGSTTGVGAPLTSSLTQCPPGSWVSGIEVPRTEPRTGMPLLLRPGRELRYSCRPLK